MKFLETKNNLSILETDSYLEEKWVIGEEVFDQRMSTINTYLVNKFESFADDQELPTLITIVAPGDEEDMEDMFDIYMVSFMDVIMKQPLQRKEGAKRPLAREEIRDAVFLNVNQLTCLVNHVCRYAAFNLRIVNTEGKEFSLMLK